MGFFDFLGFGGDDGGGGGNAQSTAVFPKAIQLPQYSFTEPRLKLTSDFVSDNISRLSRGEYPSYYDKALPTLREGMHRPLYETYYGRAGEPGLLRGAYETGSITGVGPRSTQAQVERTLFDYATAERQINEYLTKMGVDIMREEAYRFPLLSTQIPKGPDAQLGYPTIIPGSTAGNEAAGDLGSSFGSLIPEIARAASQFSDFAGPTYRPYNPQDPQSYGVNVPYLPSNVLDRQRALSGFGTFQPG